QEQPEQDLLLACEPEALGDRLPARTVDLTLGPERRQAPDRPQGGGEGRRVEQVRARKSQAGDEEAAERRACDAGRASVDVLDGVRGRELMALDQTRDDGVHPWDAQGV